MSILTFMKRLLFLVAICLTSMILCAQQVVTLTFTGQDTSGRYLRLNRVVISNLSRNWTETIYWPDTVLEMQNSTRIAEHVANVFSLEQNIPNPFDGITTVQLHKAEAGRTTLWVSDLSGKELVRYEGLLSDGTHRFRLSLPNAQVYFLHAQSGKYSASIKMVSKGNGGSSMIEYEGQTLSYKLDMGKAMKGSTNQTFVLGDMMEYVGYVIIDGVEFESEHITQTQHDSQFLTLRFQSAIGRACPGTPTVTDYDGNIYNTVLIGEQCWMRENLRATHYADGTSIPVGSTTSHNVGYRYVPNNDTNNVYTYGYLYNLKAALNAVLTSTNNPSGVQGVCPTGWHVPSADEWMQLVDYVSEQDEYVCDGIAKSLADTIGWHTYSGPCTVGNDLSTNNTTFFSALPAGAYSRNGYTYGFSEEAHFWSTTNPTSEAYISTLVYNSSSVFIGEAVNIYGFSVRCIRDVSGSAYAQACPDIPSVTDYDGNIYNTVKIGNQCWMRENLRTEHYSDGTEIAMGNTYSNSTPYRYNPDNDHSVVATYGYLYNWTAVIHPSTSSSVNRSGVQGICPEGWHVPSEAEWMQLFDFVSSQSENVCNSNTSYIAKSLAATRGWYTHDGTCSIGNDRTTNNVTGFSALPAGFYALGNYFTFGDYVSYWSATENSNSKVFGHSLIYYDAIVYNGDVDKDNAISVRCLLDEEQDPVVPTVITSAVYTQLSLTSAISGGIVTSTGGADVTARGVCWSTLPLPTLADSHSVDGGGTGSFSSNITGLAAGTSYYVRAYATNSVGTAYGNQVIFTTPCSPQACPDVPSVTDYDNNIYNTVQIGNQCWMRENLRTTHYADGTSIPLGGSTYSSDSAFLYYPYGIPDSVSTYGYLYNWTAVMHNASSSSTNPSGVQGVCPNGWHVPSDAEWTQLANYVSLYHICGSNSTHIAKSLASARGWETYSGICTVGNDQDSNNSTDFSVLPAGSFRFYQNDFGKYAFLWSATYFGDGFAYYRSLRYNNATLDRDYLGWVFSGLSVRCLRD